MCNCQSCNEQKSMAAATGVSGVQRYVSPAANRYKSKEAPNEDHDLYTRHSISSKDVQRLPKATPAWI